MNPFLVKTSLRTLFFLFICVTWLAGQSPTRIGVIIDGPWGGNTMITEIVQKEVLDLTEGEFNIEFPPDKMIVGDWNYESIKRSLDQLLADPEVDIIFTMGVIVSHEASQRGALPKPVISPFIIDTDLQELPNLKGGSGIKNWSYIAIPSGMQRDIKAFLSIVSFKKMIMLVNKEVYNAIPHLQERTEQVVGSFDIDPRVVPVETIQDALQALDSPVDAVYLAPLLQLTDSDFQQLVDLMNERKIPSFSMLGRSEVEKGVLASISPDIFPRIARRVALNVQRILLGEEAGEIPFAFSSGEELSINVGTGRKINVYPDWGLLTEAVLIGEERKQLDKNWTLVTAVKEGIKANNDIRAAEKEVAAGSKNISIARANLLPQIDLSATGLQIDKDRAGGFQAERSLGGTATFTQVIYADDAWMNYGIQKSLQQSLESGYRATQLDVARDVASAYMQILNAKSLEQIQKENLKLSRSNLELARIREAVGFSGRAEVYRWDSQIASNRKDVISANAMRNVAEIQLNRLMNRPLEENFATRDAGLEEEGILSEQGTLFQFMSTPFFFKALRKFFVAEGLNNSPEIQQLAAAIDAQDKILRNTKRAFYLPDVVAQGELTRRFWEGGVGSAAVPGGSDDTDWSVALNLSFPLYDGSAKYASRAQAVETLDQLRYEKKGLTELIEQGIRSASHTMGASYAGIEQSEDAAVAARLNLELIIDAYSQGVVSITDLLEAQNASLVADQASAVAIYQFLLDLMSLERAIGQFHFLRTPEEKAAFFQRLDSFFVQEGIRR